MTKDRHNDGWARLVRAIFPGPLYKCDYCDTVFEGDKCSPENHFASCDKAPRNKAKRTKPEYGKPLPGFEDLNKEWEAFRDKKK